MGDALPRGFFSTDLHGQIQRYEKLQSRIVQDYLVPMFRKIRSRVGSEYPEVFLIPGNDDPGSTEAALIAGADEGLWHFAHERKFQWRGFAIYGLAYIPP